MKFEWDPAKSEANQVKHGVDFETAKKLWDDPRRFAFPCWTSDENRWLVIGRIGAQSWRAIITMRDDAIRIISVRRARDYEVEAYEGKD